MRSSSKKQVASSIFEWQRCSSIVWILRSSKYVYLLYALISNQECGKSNNYIFNSQWMKHYDVMKFLQMKRQRERERNVALQLRKFYRNIILLENKHNKIFLSNNIRIFKNLFIADLLILINYNNLFLACGCFVGIVSLIFCISLPRRDFNFTYPVWHMSSFFHKICPYVWKRQILPLYIVIITLLFRETVQWPLIR